MENSGRGREPTKKIERTSKYMGAISTPIPQEKKTAKMEITNRRPIVTRIYRLIGIEIIGTDGRGITIWPGVRDRTKIRGRQTNGRVVSIKEEVEIRGRTIRTDHRSKVYKDSEWALKPMKDN